MYTRTISGKILQALNNNQIAIIYGTRQVGKTTLTKQLVNQFLESKEMNSKDILQVSGDDIDIREVLSSQKTNTLLDFVRDIKLLIVDEAQRIENVGVNLKILYDNLPDLKIIATGSSSFELANKINEPLTGRNNTFLLTPFSFAELTEHERVFDIKSHLDIILKYGTYPKIYALPNIEDKKSNLGYLTTDYLYKDILEWENIQKSSKLTKILEYLALQIGGVVSYYDIATKLEISSKTVEKYIDLLEKAFVIFHLRAYSKNKGNELTRSFKIYFWDIGIRNSLIRNFGDLHLRADVGNMWENYCVAERIKRNMNFGLSVNHYFWRNYEQNEVDFVEDRDGKIFGYEFKYDKSTMAKGSYNFTKQYHGTTLELVNNNNIEEFLF
jgi:uncharacterized protein